eukprot:CCRYP_019407-RA/>CCRYP_019407-RA protein AED:0.07 eAED:0.07 QI:216/1/1/1/0.5/0.4/5/431/365
MDKKSCVLKRDSPGVDVVSVSYNDLLNSCCNLDGLSTDASFNIDDLIDKAFGSTSLNSLGIIAITEVPNLSALRLKLLPLARKLQLLPSEELDKITAHEASYQVGWSHGREKLEGDKPDFSKGSFYANPLTDDLTSTMLKRRKHDVNSTGGDIHGDDNNNSFRTLLSWDESIPSVPSDEYLVELAKSNPAFFAPNIWPKTSIPELESVFKETGELVHQIGIMVAKCCDSYVASRCPGYKPHKLEEILRYSKCCKARLLHYFATETSLMDNEKNDDTDFSDWCGWHNDHGSITGLLPALYLDSDGHIVDCPDPLSGLYIKSRSGRLIHARLPSDSLAFQVGETMQVHTGGLLQATPHAVRGCKGTA